MLWASDTFSIKFFRFWTAPLPLPNFTTVRRATHTSYSVAWLGCFFFQRNQRQVCPTPKIAPAHMGPRLQLLLNAKTKAYQKIEKWVAWESKPSLVLGREALLSQYYRQLNFCKRKRSLYLYLHLAFLLENRSTSALTAPGQGKVIFPFQTLTKVAAAPTPKLFSNLNRSWTFF